MVGRYVGNFVNLPLVKSKFSSFYHDEINKDEKGSSRSKCIRTDKEYQVKQGNQHKVTIKDNNMQNSRACLQHTQQ